MEQSQAPPRFQTPFREPVPPSTGPNGPSTRILSAAEEIPSPLLTQKSSDLPRVRGYELLSLIGSGGMGVVYKARDRNLHRTVAIKMLHQAVLADSESRERFQAEAEAVARLQHPNIIQVFEIGTVQPMLGEVLPSPFIALEFIDGGSLARFTDSPQPPLVAARMVEKLARAAHAAHTLGVVHRDLKPANVLLTYEGEPKLADFGIAKHIGTPGEENRCLTQAGMSVGTPEYMAPEQVAGEQPTPAMDIHALGVILYQLLTARVPFQGPTPADTMYLVRHQEPVSPRRLQPGLPRDLETICFKCMAKSPARRYESAEALADDLARWLAQRPIHARPMGAAERMVQWARREPTIAALWAAVVVVALAGVSGVVWKWQEATERAAAAREAAQEARDTADAERWERYRADVGAVSNALQLHHAGAARRALEAAPALHRNWEWAYFSRQLQLAQDSLGGTGAKVQWAAVSPDARTVMSTGDDYTATFWDVPDRRLICSIPKVPTIGHSAFCDRARLLAYEPAPAQDKNVIVRDLVTGESRHEFEIPGTSLSAMKFSPDETTLAVGSHDGMVRLWDVNTGRLLQKIKAHEFAVGGFAFSGDGRFLATAGSRERTAKIWAAETGKLVHTLRGATWHVDAVQFSPAGDRLLGAAWFPSNTLWLWNTETGELVQEMSGHTNRVTSLSFSADGSRVATSSMDQSIRLWDGKTGKLLRILHGHSGRVNQAAFDPSGTRLVSAAHDGTIRTWDVEKGSPIAVLMDHTGEVLAARFGEDGNSIVSAGRDTTVKLWNRRAIENNNTLRGHTKFVYNVAFHPDGRRVASAAWDGTVRVWDATAGKQLAVLKCDDIAFAVAFHPGGKLLASGSRDGWVRLWDLETGNEAHRWKVPAHHWQDSRLAFSPNGDLLATGDAHANVRVLDVRTRTEYATLKGHTACIRDLSFGPDGSWLATGAERGDETIRIWDLQRKETIQVLKGHTDYIYSIAVNKQGTLLATGSTDGTARLWDTKTWTQLETVLKHGTGVYGLAFSPDGTRLSSGCEDTTVRLWDVKTQQEVAELHGHLDYVHSVAFSPDGTRLVSGSGDCTLRVWDTIPCRARAR